MHSRRGWFSSLPELLEYLRVGEKKEDEGSRQHTNLYIADSIDLEVQVQ